MYKKTTLNDLPKRQRKGLSRFETTDEWRMMKTDLDRGLKPQDALQVVLTDEEKQKYRIRNRVTVARFIKRYLGAKGFTYRVRTFRRDNCDFIVVQNLPNRRRPN